MGGAVAVLHHKGGATFSPDVTLGIQAKEFNLYFTRPENLMVGEYLGAFWQTPSEISCGFT